jgi:ankyrin repeat protein
LVCSHVQSNFFQHFLELCLKKNFDLDTLNEDGLTLIHEAAKNNNFPGVASYLLAKGFPTTILSNPIATAGNAKVYPLFFAMLNKSEPLIQLLSQGLTAEQIESTQTALEVHQKYRDDQNKDVNKAWEEARNFSR